MSAEMPEHLAVAVTELCQNLEYGEATFSDDKGFVPAQEVSVHLRQTLPSSLKKKRRSFQRVTNSNHGRTTSEVRTGQVYSDGRCFVETKCIILIELFYLLTPPACPYFGTNFCCTSIA